MLIVTTENIEGKTIIETIGFVRGNTIRAKHIGKDIIAGFRGIVGGEVKEYTEMMIESREQAMERLIDDAKKKGANAVVGLRFTTSMVSAGAAELLAYGTGVKIK